MPDVLLATGADRPALWEDEFLLVEAIERRGLSVAPAVWSDPTADWAASRAVVLRSVFDYVADRDGFCAWADRVGATTALHNPPSVIRWNSHKAYLRELSSAGIPIVPTAWLDAGSTADLRSLLAENGWNDAVVKPAVGNGARGAARVSEAAPASGQQHLDALLAAGDVMVQPFLRATESPGEHALIVIAGRFSHAIRKDQMLAGREFSLDRTPLVDPEPEELALVDRIAAAVPEWPLLYARADTVVDGDVTRLMELELIEPVLFFSRYPAAADAVAEALLNGRA
jgi:hypothetical protein